MILPAGTLFFRGIDSPPDELTPESVLRTNRCEGILWTTLDSQTAQTYIPDWGCKTSLKIHWTPTESVRPNDGIHRELIAACGGKVEVLEREWKTEGRDLKDYPAHLIVNNTFGTPMCWRWEGKSVTWQDVIDYLQKLGYTEAKADACLWIKTKHDGNGNWAPAPADSRFLGSLVIYEAIAPLGGIDKTGSGHDLLDPAYHHAAKWGKQSDGDFLKINDYCQTEIHGNVGHYAIALLKPAIAKLRVAGIVPAYHHEWSEIGPITLAPTAEEIFWRESLKKAA